MTVIPTDVRRAISGVCAMRTEVNYTKSPGDSGTVMIPAETRKELVSSDGSYYESSVTYEGCRQYSSESTLRFDDASGQPQRDSMSAQSPALPVPHAEVDLRLISTIDSKTSFAGDVIEAALIHPVRDTAGRVLSTGTVVHGHLAQVERIYWPREEIRLAMRFDSITIAGSERPLKLEPAGTRDLRGRAIFSFPGSRIVLGKKFQSRWRIGAAQ